MPLLIISILNCFIVDALRRSSNRVTSGRLQSCPKPETEQVRQRRHNAARQVSPRNRRVTVTLVAVIVVFIVCVTPDAVMSTVFGFGYYDETDLVRGVREITDFLLLVNSASNFLLYCVFNRTFRNRFRMLVARQYRNCCGDSSRCRSKVNRPLTSTAAAAAEAGEKQTGVQHRRCVVDLSTFLRWNIWDGGGGMVKEGSGVIAEVSQLASDVNGNNNPSNDNIPFVVFHRPASITSGTTSGENYALAPRLSEFRAEVSSSSSPKTRAVKFIEVVVPSPSRVVKPEVVVTCV